MEDSKLEQSVGNRIGNIEDLPEELLSQLSVQKIDDLERKILNTLRTRYGGIASLDELIVGVYRDSGYITTDRRAFAAKLYRMSKSGLIKGANGKKGIYLAV